MKIRSLVPLIFVCMILAALIMVSCANSNSTRESQPAENPTVQEDKSTAVTSQPVEEDKNPSKGEEPTKLPVKEVLPPPMSFLASADYSLPADKVYYKGRAVVLTYHHISTKPVSSITIKPERFESDLQMLKNGGFNVISFRDMINGMDGKAKLPPNAVVITFDDGYESFYTYAYPLLKKYNMPAIEFVITSWTDGLVELSKDLNSLNPDEIREMYKSGLIDIQSHSHKGHDYIIRNEKGENGGFLAYQIYDQKTSKYEDPESYKKRVFADLTSSIPIIQKYTDNVPDTLCFPFGHFNSRLVGVAKEAGFKYFVTTLYGDNRENSKSIYVYRIRSGDAKLDSQELKKNIIYCGREVQPATP